MVNILFHQVVLFMRLLNYKYFKLKSTLKYYGSNLSIKSLLIQDPGLIKSALAFSC